MGYVVVGVAWLIITSTAWRSGVLGPRTASHWQPIAALGLGGFCLSRRLHRSLLQGHEGIFHAPMECRIRMDHAPQLAGWRFSVILNGDDASCSRPARIAAQSQSDDLHHPCGDCCGCRDGCDLLPILVVLQPADNNLSRSLRLLLGQTRALHQFLDQVVQVDTSLHATTWNTGCKLATRLKSFTSGFAPTSKYGRVCATSRQ